MKRRHALIGLCLLALCGACREQRASAAQHPDGYETLELRYQGSTGNVLYPELAEDLGYLKPLKLNYVGNTISGPQDLQSAVTGDVDFALAFNGVIAKMVAAIRDLDRLVGQGGPAQAGADPAGSRLQQPVQSLRAVALSGGVAEALIATGRGAQ